MPNNLIKKTTMTIKRLFLAAVLMILAVPAFSQDEVVIDVYIMDNPKDLTTNLRDAPKGKIVKQLPRGVYALYLSEVRNGWWKVVDMWDADEDKGQKLNPMKTYWIHYSVIATGTRNYGGERLTLRAAPNKTAKAVWSFKNEISLRPLEVRGEWAKVCTIDGKHTGWIEMEWLCGNPVTNCC